MGAPKNRQYKRSWRNLLLNARYQLGFTSLMVGICALLMVGLDWCVMRAAEKATTVAMDNVLGVACQKPDMAALGPHPQVTLDDDDDQGDAEFAPAPQGAKDEPAAAPQDEPGEQPSDADEPAPGERHEPGHVVVDIVEEDVPPPPVPVAAIARYHLCRAQQASTLQRLRERKGHILYVLIGSGILLCLGLGIYGIKMTHKVAGPLHKVGLYFAKMRDGKYDTVYNLRKGDQLVAFYDHFKDAHEGMRKVEIDDVAVLRDLIAAADAAGAADQSPEVKAALDELREVLARKEDAIG